MSQKVRDTPPLPAWNPRIVRATIQEDGTWEVGFRRRLRSGVASRSWLGEVDRETISTRVLYFDQAAVISFRFVGSKVKVLVETEDVVRDIEVVKRLREYFLRSENPVERHFCDGEYLQ